MNKKLKFSQRMGITKVKSEIQIDSMDDDLRIGLWNAYDASFVQPLRGEFSLSQTFFDEFYTILWIDYFKRPLDNLNDRLDTLLPMIRGWFYEGEWNEVYDYIEFITQIESPADINEFRNICNQVMEKELSGFRFVGELITQITDETEINEIEGTIEMAGRTKLTGVREHLKTALSMLSDRKNPDYRNSVKESISAVESIARIIADNSKATLGDALKIIEDKTKLHAALKKGFMSIYGYTSDEDGIRHAILEEPNVNFEDAKYMLVSCSAFINYLIMKASNEGIKI